MKYFKPISILIFIVIGIFACHGKDNQTGNTSLTKEEEEFRIEGEKYLKNPKKYILSHEKEWTKGLESTNPKERSDAIINIELNRFKDQVPRLMDIAQNDSDEQVRNDAIVTLAQLGDKEVIPIMLKTLNNNNIGIRSVACRKLLKLKRKEGIPVLIEIMCSDDVTNAAESLFFLRDYTKKKDFGKFIIKITSEGRFVIEDPTKQKEVCDRWKKWWMEEGDKFEFPK